MIKTRTKHLSLNSGSALLTGAAAVMLLFVCISTPVVNSMRMYRISNVWNGAVRYVDVGLWGYCVQPLKFGFNSVVYDPAVREGCSIPSIGFSLDSVVADALKTPDINGFYSKKLTAILILFPIATIMSAMSCILQTALHLFSKTRSMQIGISSRGVRGIFFFNVLTTLVVLFAFVIQITVVVMGKARIIQLSLRTSNYNLQFHGENTPWLSGIALLCHFIDLFLINTWRKQRLSVEQQKDTEKAQKTAKQPKQKKGKKGPKVAFDADDDVPKKEDEIIEERKEDAVNSTAPPEYNRLDGYIVEDATKKS